MSTATLPGWVDTFEPRPDLPTREQNVKWVIVVDRDLPGGLQVNAAACLAAAVGKAVPGLVGAGGVDASGGSHTGLPWTGCMVLGATGAIVRRVRAEALDHPELLVADMAAIAERVRVYADYLAELACAEDDDIDYHAVSIAGPRPAVERLTGRLPLLR